jgi:hypothetical protein
MRSSARLLAISSVCALAAIGCAFLSSSPAMAQAPYNTTVQPTPFPNALRGAATYNSQQYQNSQWKGVTCTYDQAASSSIPSTTFKIQGFDAATQSYYDLQTSAAITANNAPGTVQVAPGAVATGSPTGMTATALQLPGYWRVSLIVAGGSAGSTGTLGCTYLK